VQKIADVAKDLAGAGVILSSMEPAMSLDRSAIETYQRDGFLVVEGLLPAGPLGRLRERLDQLQRYAAEGRAEAVLGEGHAQRESATGTATAPLRKLASMAPVDDAFRGVVSHPAVLAMVRLLTGGTAGDELAVYDDQVFMKPARCGSAKPLHQDNSYFRVTPDDCGLTCWMAIDDATVENGCMRYVPGSHRSGPIPHKALSNVHLTPDVHRPEWQEVPLPVRAGSCIFHHLLTLHGSRANHSPHSRRAYAMHYVNRSRMASCNRDLGHMLALS
jgi:phytanoyl-CoA hydroxylase